MHKSENLAAERDVQKNKINLLNLSSDVLAIKRELRSKEVSKLQRAKIQTLKLSDRETKILKEMCGANVEIHKGIIPLKIRLTTEHLIIQKI